MEWIALAVVAVVFIAIAFFLARTKAGLRSQAGDLNKAWSDVEVLIKRQNDDLPRLIQTCRSYMPAEQDAILPVTGARAACLKAKGIPEKASCDAVLRSALLALLAQAARHPDLKANSTFSQLQNDLLEIQEKIEDRRELFNEDVRRFNRRLAHPPAAWLAAKLKLKPHPLFEVSEEPVKTSSIPLKPE